MDMPLKPIHFLFLFLCLTIAAQSNSTVTPQAKNQFMLQIKVSINDKIYNPKNITLSTSNIRTDATTGYDFNLSSFNFNKNVTLVIRLLAWYNNDWIARQTQMLKITDKRTPYSLGNHMMLEMMKFNNRKYQKQLFETKIQSVLKQIHIYVSYDPQSSLLVSRLQEPQTFIDPQQYIPVFDIHKDTLQYPVNITFEAVKRTDRFIDFKNQIVELGQIANKIKPRMSIVSRSVPAEMVEPLQLWKTFIFNYKSLSSINKKVNQKIDLITKRGYHHLLIQPNTITNHLQPLLTHLSKVSNITLTDSTVPTFQYINRQAYIADTIIYLQKTVRKHLMIQQYDWLSIIKQWAYYQQLFMTFGGIVWVLLDLFAYLRISSNVGISSSFGSVLNIWIITQIVFWSLRIGTFNDNYAYFGFIVFALLILMHYLISSSLQKLFSQQKHQFYYFDRTITKITLNLLILLIIVNIGLHLWYYKDMSSIQLILSSFSEFMDQLKQYYYCLAIIPQIILNFRFGRVSHLSLLRVLLFAAIAVSDDYLILLDGFEHSGLMIYRLKDDIILVLLLLQMIIYCRSNGQLIIQKANPSQQIIQKQQSLSQKSSLPIQPSQSKQKTT